MQCRSTHGTAGSDKLFEHQQGLTWSFVELTSHVLTAIGHNLRRVLAWLKALLHSILLALCWAFASLQHSNRPS